MNNEAGHEALLQTQAGEWSWMVIWLKGDSAALVIMLRRARALTVRAGKLCWGCLGGQVSLEGKADFSGSPSISGAQGQGQGRQNLPRHSGPAPRGVPLGPGHMPGTSLGNDSALM